MTGVICCPDRVEYVHLSQAATEAALNLESGRIVIPHDQLVLHLADIGIMPQQRNRGSLWKSKEFHILELPAGSGDKVRALFPQNQLEGVAIGFSEYYCPQHHRVYQEPYVDRSGSGQYHAKFEYLPTNDSSGLTQRESMKLWRECLANLLGYKPRQLEFSEPVTYTRDDLVYFMDPRQSIFGDRHHTPKIHTMSEVSKRLSEVQGLIKDLKAF